MNSRWIGAFAGLLMIQGNLFAENADRKSGPTERPTRAEKATFAGGCFWCMQPPFDTLPGILSNTAGYCGGKEPGPSYHEVAAGKTGHAESVQIVYDPSKISYSELLDVFWRNIDPTTVDREFVDIGRQYRTAVFYHNEEQKKLAIASKDKWEKAGVFGKPIVTGIVPATEFYPAEEYHQNYYRKNPIRYSYYRRGSGRDRYLKKIWGGAYRH